MKKILIVLAASALLVSCNSISKTSDNAESETPAMAAEWVEVILNVDGMTCDGCENAINAGVEALDGVKFVESSCDEGWTKVKYDKNLTSVEDIEGKIADTGYVVEGEKTSLSL